MSKAGSGCVLLVLTPDTGPGEDPELAVSPTLEFLVRLDENDFGFRQLYQWEKSHTALAIVLPPDSRIMRLRSIDDLQPLTLRRLD